MGYHLNLVSNDTQRDDGFVIGEIREQLAQSDVFGVERDRDGYMIVSKDSDNDFAAFFSNGYVFITQTTEKDIKLFLELGEILNARVRGDEGETYKTPTKTYIHKNDKHEEEIDEELRREIRSAEIFNTTTRVIQIVLGIAFVIALVYDLFNLHNSP